MEPLSDSQLKDVLRHWRAPSSPATLATGVWARVDSSARQTPHWLQSAWAFRLALSLTVLLWVAAIATPSRGHKPTASTSLTIALAQAGTQR